MTREYGLLLLGLLACAGPDKPVDPTRVEDIDGDGYSADDCDDNDASVHPGADERCDGIDSDCDGQIDEDAVDGRAGYADGDGDGYGDEASPLTGCTVVLAAGDCDDTDPAVHPGATDLCDVDRDCDPSSQGGAIISGTGYASLAEAIASAGDGAIVEVCDGLHTVTGIEVAVDLTLRSFSGDRQAAILDGGDQSSVFVVNGGALTLQSLTVRRGSGTPSYNPQGGGVRVLSGALVAEDCVFSEHGGAYGAAIHALGEVTLIDSEFVDNHADSEGGALWVDGGPITIENTTFLQNTAYVGGALCAFDADLTISGSHFEGNAAGWWSGAIYSFESQVHIIDTVARDNTAQFGGAIAVESVLPELIALEGVELSDNIATTSGGALMAYGAMSVEADTATVLSGNEAALWGGAGYLVSYTGSPISWTGGVLLDNRAGDIGGAMYVEAGSGGLVTVSSLLAEGNFADTSGGGLYLSRSPIVVQDSTLLDNSTNGTGGGGSANFTSAGAIALDRVLLQGNTAADGGGIDVYLARLDLTDCVLEQNSAIRGGGVYVDPVSMLLVEGSDFGVDALANTPDDVYVDGSGDPSRSGFGADATFTCGPYDWLCQ